MRLMDANAPCSTSLEGNLSTPIGFLRTWSTWQEPESLPHLQQSSGVLLPRGLTKPAVRQPRGFGSLGRAVAWGSSRSLARTQSMRAERMSVASIVNS